MTIDLTHYREVMDDLRDALHGAGQYGDAQSIVLDESERLLKQVVRFTPPQSKDQGERAIAGELGAFMSEAEESLMFRVQARFARSTNIDGYWNLKHRGRVRLQWGLVDDTAGGSRMKAAHYAAKNAKGKVPKRKGTHDPSVWASRLVVRYGNKAAYLRRMMDRVGRLKAAWGGWATIAMKMSPWVKRHVRSPFAIYDGSGLLDRSNPNIVVGNRAPGVSEPRLLRHYNEAVRVRSTAMARRMALVLSGYNKALARRMKISARQYREAYDAAHPENEYSYGNSGIES